MELTESTQTLAVALAGARDRTLLVQAYELGRDDEARNVARALHDDAGQLLVSAHLAFEMLMRDVSAKHRTAAQQVRELLEAIDRELRVLSQELRPPMLDDLGLLPAVEFLAKVTAQRGELRVEVRGSPGGRLVPVYETLLYRVAQEGLTNVIRHAHAKHAVIELGRRGAEVSCCVRDDGVGINDENPTTGLGLRSLRARVGALGGTLQVLPAREHGTELRAELPLEEPHDTRSLSR